MNDFKLGNISFGPALKDFDKYFVGFDKQFNEMSRLHEDFAKTIPNYPPYNIKKTGDNTYAIEIAVAGFGEQNIEIEFKDNSLIVKGTTSTDTAEADETFLFKGIANRAFTRAFALNDQVEVKDAEMINGMLKIFLERIIPEHKKAKKVEIKTASEKKKQFLRD